MNRLLTFFAWVLSGLQRRKQPPALGESEGDRLVQQQDHSPPAVRVAETQVAQPADLEKPAAQGRKSDEAKKVAQPADLEATQRELAGMLEADTDEPATEADPRDGPYRATPLRVDTASWEFEAPSGEWSRWRELCRIAKSGACSVEWVDVFGKAVEMHLDRGKPGSGSLVLSTGTTRIEIRRSRAEVQNTAWASEVEGLPAWGERWLPRVAYWLLGVELVGDDLWAITDALHELGVLQRRIEPCVDVLGMQIVPGDERCIVSSAGKWSNWRHDKTLDGFGAGKRGGEIEPGKKKRKATPSSIGIYDKVAKMSVERGPAHEALLETWKRHGWRPGIPVTRIELRCWGEALQLEGLDATHPRSAFVAETVRRLFVDGLSRHRLVVRESESKAKRLSDRPEHPAWVLAREAGGSAEPVLLRRDVAKRQVSAIKRHAIRRFGQEGAKVEELLRGDGSGAKARAVLEYLVRGEDWVQDLGRARTRYAELLEQAESEDDDGD